MWIWKCRCFSPELIKTCFFGDDVRDTQSFRVPKSLPGKHILQWWLWKGLSGFRGESNLELFFLNNVLPLVKQCFTPGLRRVLAHHETRLPNFFWHVGEDIQHGRQSSELFSARGSGGFGRGGPLRLLQWVGRKEDEQLRNLDYPNWVLNIRDLYQLLPQKNSCKLIIVTSPIPKLKTSRIANIGFPMIKCW